MSANPPDGPAPPGTPGKAAFTRFIPSMPSMPNMPNMPNMGTAMMGLPSMNVPSMSISVPGMSGLAAVPGMGWMKTKDGASQGDDDEEETHNHEDEEEDDPMLSILAKKRSDAEVAALLGYLPDSVYTLEYKAAPHIVSTIASDKPLDEAWCESECNKYLETLDVVNSQLSRKILENYSKFFDGMNQIKEIDTELQHASVQCKSGRKSLAEAKRTIIASSLTVVKKEKRKEAIEGVLKIILDVQALRNAEENITKLLADKQYSNAILLAESSRSLVKELAGLQCTANLGAVINDAASSIDKQMQEDLRVHASAFDEDNFLLLLRGFLDLGKGDFVINMFPMLFLDVVPAVAENILHDFQFVRAGDKKKFRRFDRAIEKVEDDRLLPCVKELFGELTAVLFNHVVVRAKTKPLSRMQSREAPTLAKLFASMDASKIDLWNEVVRMVATFLEKSRLNTLKTESFIMVIAYTRCMIDVGAEFAGVRSARLEAVVKATAEKYFNEVHADKMEEMRTMLENDYWTRVPVPAGYGLESIKEFELHMKVPRVTEPGKSFMELYNQLGNPFLRDITDAIETADASEKAEEDVVTGKGPIVTSSTIQLCRTIGNYVALLEAFDMIRPAVLSSLAHLVEFYMYTVYSFFGKHAGELPLDLPPRLRITLFRLGKWLDDVPAAAPSSSSHTFASLAGAASLSASLTGTSHAAPPPPPPPPGAGGSDSLPMSPSGSYRPIRLSPEVDITSPQTLYALQERAVAVESLIFVQGVLMAVQPRLVNLLKNASKNGGASGGGGASGVGSGSGADASALSKLEDFYQDTVGVMGDLRVFVYQNVSRLLIDFDALLPSIAAAKFDISEDAAARLEASQYVTTLCTQFNQLSGRLRSLGTEILSEDVQHLLWDSVIKTAMLTIVEGWSRIKKCSEMGPQQMNVDLSSITQVLGNVSGIKPVPYRSVVQEWFMALYLKSDAEILSWVEAHPEYTLKQVLAILNLGPVAQRKKKAERDFLKQNVERLKGVGASGSR